MGRAGEKRWEGQERRGGRGKREVERMNMMEQRKWEGQWEEFDMEELTRATGKEMLTNNQNTKIKTTKCTKKNTQELQEQIFQ